MLSIRRLWRRLDIDPMSTRLVFLCLIDCLRSRTKWLSKICGIPFGQRGVTFEHRDVAFEHRGLVFEHCIVESNNNGSCGWNVAFGRWSKKKGKVSYRYYSFREQIIWSIIDCTMPQMQTLIPRSKI